MENIETKKKYFEIEELEISINNNCHLSCNNCGFNIPEQPFPTKGKDTSLEVFQNLTILQNKDILIKRLVILGGEATFNKSNLEEVLSHISKLNNIRSIELVSHGLYPQGLSIKALNQITQLTISVYFQGEELIELWQKYIAINAPHVKLKLRTDKLWDQWKGNSEVDDQTAQVMFSNCWYKKHCTTIERDRLFICSRIAKESADEDGIMLSNEINQLDIINYLSRTKFLPSCKTCIPMMGLDQVPAGIQKDNRIQKMQQMAIKYFNNILNK